jgi:hypothetical protein
MHGITPPEEPQSPTTGTTRDRRQDNPLASLGGAAWLNTELVLYVVVVLLTGLIVLVSDQLGAGTWVSALQWLTIAYILSRGIAKASRVYET